MRSFAKLLLFTALSVSFSVHSQTQGIAYPAVGKGVATTFVTDYHSLGINSSALGWGTGYDGKHFTMGSSEFAFGVYSDKLTADKLRNFASTFRKQIFSNDSTPIDWNKQREAAAQYAEAGIALNLSYNWLGFSYQSEKFGGIAFNIRENYSYYSKFNQETTDIIFRGKLASYFDSLTVVYGSDTSVIANRNNISQDTLSHVVLGSAAIPLNISQVTRGSEVRMQWNRTYNIGYGRRLFGADSVFVLYGGIGARYIQSMAEFNMKSDETGLYVYSSMSPVFNINYGSVAQTNPSAYPQTSGGIPKVVGTGYGLDFSVSAILFNSIRVAAAVNNIGSVTYNRNVYRVRDSLLADIRLDGLSSDNIGQSVNQFLKDQGILQLEGQDKYVLQNAATFRFGASIKTGGILNVGFDVVAPFNSENPGSIQNTVYSFGGEVRPLKWIALSAGYYGGGIYANNIPVGVNFILGGGAYEFGISSTDAISFFTKNGHSISTAFGFARFRF